MVRNHEQWVYSSTILIYWAVMTIPRSSSTSCYLEFKKAQPRSWNAAKYTREYEYSWKRFDRQHSTRSWWIIQLFKKFGNTIGNRWWCRGFIEEKELRTVWTKNHCNQYFYLVSKSKEKKSRRQILCLWLTMQRVLGLAAKFPDQTEFQSWIMNFQVEVCAKAKNLALVLQWIKRSKQPARWRTSSIQNQLRKNIGLWRIRLNDGGRIEMVLRCCFFDLRNYWA